MGAPKGNKNAAGHGAPKGNKNALGFGAPYGSKNAMKHGLYCSYGVYIPPTPENAVIIEAMSSDGATMDYKTFNAYKKKMHAEVREAIMQNSEIVERNGKRFIARQHYNSHTGKTIVKYYKLDEPAAE